MAVLTEIAYAKINLALHVRKQRKDGYHELETVFAFADQGDILRGELADDLELEIVGPFAHGLAADEHNLVAKAAMALWQEIGTRKGARLVLEKNLPIASGIGGGSADAAAALRLLAQLWGVEADLMPVAARLGADVPACLLSRTAFGTGVGDELTTLPHAGVAGLPVLLINPNIACPTGPIFKTWDGIDRGSLDPANWLEGRNDLEQPAISLVPEIGQLLGLLRRLEGVRIARMSGSGASCFGLFDTMAQRDAAYAMVKLQRPNLWAMAARLR